MKQHTPNMTIPDIVAENDLSNMNESVLSWHKGKAQLTWRIIDHPNMDA
jgi:hypothetical protein